MTVTLAAAMESAATDVHIARTLAEQQFGPGLFDRAVEHHTRRHLRADIAKGTTRDRDGLRARYIAYDWQDAYIEAPHFVWFDFFRGPVMNSVSRMARGLQP